MSEFISVKSKPDTYNLQPRLSELRAVQKLVQHNRIEGLAALNRLFRSGTVPEPQLDGRYAGELIATDIAPGLTPLFDSLLNAWLPWLGKTFNATQRSGDNIFTKDSYLLARFFNPFYRRFIKDGPSTYRGFSFRTYVAPGVIDSDHSVLKIDYNLKENPALTVRRVLDELVQIGDQFYLGKAHVRWWWRPRDSWQTVAYFSLAGNSMADLQS
jgi:hypothetical protein